MSTTITFSKFSETKLGTEKEKIIQALEAKLVDLRELFNYHNSLEILIKESKENTIPELGTGGFAGSKDLIELSIDENHATWGTETILKNVQDSLAHEFNHVVRWATVSYGYTLIESIISEGIATAFEKEYCKVSPLWGTYTNEDIIVFKKITESIPGETWYVQTDVSKWLFGNEGLPSFFGYRLGTYLAENYMQSHPGISWLELTSKPYTEILQTQTLIQNY